MTDTSLDRVREALEAAVEYADLNKGDLYVKKLEQALAGTLAALEAHLRADEEREEYACDVEMQAVRLGNDLIGRERELVESRAEVERLRAALDSHTRCPLCGVAQRRLVEPLRSDPSRGQFAMADEPLSNVVHLPGCARAALSEGEPE